MATYIDSWCRIEGALIPDLKKEYGTFKALPDTTKIFYGTPEIQISNPDSLLYGVVYRVVPLSELGYETIKEIDENYTTLLADIVNYNKTVDTTAGDLYYFEPFVVDESSIIFHADSASKTFTHFSIVYVDKYATPKIVTISGKYTGDPIPVGDAFDLKDVEISVVYSDGNTVLLKEGYTVQPENRIIANLGSNTIRIGYESPEGTTFSSSFIIEGVKKLIGIDVIYDGPQISIGQEAEKKYFMVIAKYSDDTSATVTDFSFPEGNIVSSTGAITVYYKGFYATANIPTYEVTSARLIAYYNGPNIEISKNFDISYCNIKIYYQSDTDVSKTYYEDISPEDCTFITRTVTKEGINYFDVRYNSKFGEISTKIIVPGIKPGTQLNFIEAEYTGPSIPQNKSYSIDKVICKAHYSDGSIVIVKNFTVESNVVPLIGLNEYLLTYKEKDTTVTTTFGVIGIEPESTTESGYSPTVMQNHYPEATYLNNRYRGPAEAYKHDAVSHMLYENILNINKIFADIEKSFNDFVSISTNENNVASITINNVHHIESTINKWSTDKRFTSGKYKEAEQ